MEPNMPLLPNPPSRTPLFVQLARVARFRPIWSLAAGGLLLAACASGPPVPTEKLVEAQAAISRAIGAGAADLAPAELGLARQKLTRANAAVDATNHESAARLATEAQADANLAEAKAKSAKAQRAASEVGEGNRVLRDELMRSAQ
jgi:hypothetical protein